jgi:hypothetical protein
MGISGSWARVVHRESAARIARSELGSGLLIGFDADSFSMVPATNPVTRISKN